MRLSATLLVGLCLSACTLDRPTPMPPLPDPTSSASPIATPVAKVTETPAAPEYHAFWVDAFHVGIKSPQEADQLVRDMQAARANVVFAQVRKRGDAYFNRPLA